MKNKKGQMIMMNLMFMFLGIVILIAFIGPLDDQLGVAQNEDNLNCKGYVDWDANQTGSDELSYNSTIGEKSGLACTMIDLYLPYIIIVVLIASVTKLMYGKTQQVVQPEYGGY